MNPHSAVSVPVNLTVFDHLPRCLTVLDVYNSIRDAANLPPISDGRPQPHVTRTMGG